jgi:alkylhydroperoxidase/carboxymuconolactone decarboxylase family protein YurZ
MLSFRQSCTFMISSILIYRPNELSLRTRKWMVVDVMMSGLCMFEVIVHVQWGLLVHDLHKNIIGHLYHDLTILLLNNNIKSYIKINA